MTWRHYLRTNTREPRFLWRMSLGILALGVVLGLVVDSLTQAWIDLQNPGEILLSDQSPWGAIRQAAEQSQWWQVWWGVPHVLAAQWQTSRGLTALALLTGAAWMAFLLQSVQVRSWRDVRLAAPFVALGLGALSVWPTVFCVLWQEHACGIAQSDDLAGGLRYYILGVGLREEFCKLLLFLPLLPVLVWRRDELAALVSAGCVGVGFGMEENIGYIGGSLGTATLARLLTPLPLHMALTGLTGLAAYRACRWPREWGAQFLATFGLMVLAHGFYDSLLVVPALVEYNVGAFIIFVLLVYQFFRQLRPLQARRHDTISLTANFLICVTLVASATFVYLSAAVGWQLAAEFLMQGIAAQGLMVYLFLREMPEGLIDR
jgi:RsiW-degrading membrane proteinase PrsW (M82 family)